MVTCNVCIMQSGDICEVTNFGVTFRATFVGTDVGVNNAVFNAKYSNCEQTKILIIPINTDFEHDNPCDSTMDVILKWIVETSSPFSIKLAICIYRDSSITTLTCEDYTGNEGDTYVSLSARLQDYGGYGIANKSIAFTFRGSGYTALTNIAGVANVYPLCPPAGTYQFEAEFYGDSQYDGSYCVGTITVTPSPLPQLTVNSTPTGAKIYIQYYQTDDYLYTGYQTDITLGVPIGTHNVKVTKTGYIDSEPQTVTLAAGDAKTISFTLAAGEEFVLFMGYSETQVAFDVYDTYDQAGKILRIYKKVPPAEDKVIHEGTLEADFHWIPPLIARPSEETTYYACRCWGLLNICEPQIIPWCSPAKSNEETVPKKGGECSYTGYASDAKIDHEEVPERAVKGETVSGSVSVDCIEVGETRYRVKFVLDGTVTYSDAFLLGYIGEMEVPFSFTMPDHDVTLEAEIERCNISGNWEPCVHADHKKTYTIKVAAGLYIKSCSPTEFANGWYGVTNPLVIDTVVHNDTLETVEVKLRGTANNGAKIFDEVPEVGWKNIGAGEKWTEKVGVPSWREAEVYVKDEWLRVELWEQHEGEIIDLVDIKVGNPAPPPPPPADWKMALIYGSIAVGTYVGGTIIKGASPKMKPVGTALKVGTLIPAGLCGYEVYKIVKDWLPGS